ncbi:hypothetical protein A2634_05455 [Candidatus Amesbacteria bacterium RIFCSPHIGHO2_01_FULL_48_32]|uniref:Phospholipase/carboxylesterase/thioesterase domain-containing protein n=1 Tax=Candidatus Amesbacteria bacterium RIFCSPLOWO2_01_FULL_48_25 TaxID=1797259 RepID=A0A1F4ZCS9_9BACT|nr:MAG: hypothetical protein A2634_05455 [Candidatus Amesbacteria bacterium RIFCSPHIGHO2_01_FULL_48_32]OGD04113.1 MAG: hypothetical protein A2989_01805 [Candidatus Amesbacteria bacterium RIFCSPLOWO2_01_FULL_48_25]OGM39064.1 MAG: hypothetical protein A3E13_03965 [Candidatus Woesebacteria bacterium RIFCSPHIGHO2_12_FULL_40_20]HJZ05620.1 PHB depolymerase family esterase [Patescibacteria group bacterium]
MRKKLAVAVLVLGPIVLMGAYFEWGYSQNKKVSFEGEVRQYRLHRPIGYFGKDNLPLVVALHGYGDSPRFMEMYSGWSALADREKFIVAYPYGSNAWWDKNLSWNGGSCCGVALVAQKNDVGFVNQVIQDVISKYRVDVNKIYLTGFSNGSLLAYRFVTEGDSPVRALGIVAGSTGGRSLGQGEYFRINPPSDLVSLVMIHGLQDRVVPYSGGPNEYLNVKGLVRFDAFTGGVGLWRNSDGCSTQETTKTAEVEIVEWKNCSDGAQVTAYTATRLGHTWPGGLMEWLMTGRMGEFSATKTIWEFFQKI